MRLDDFTHKVLSQNSTPFMAGGGIRMPAPDLRTSTVSQTKKTTSAQVALNVMVPLVQMSMYGPPTIQSTTHPVPNHYGAYNTPTIESTIKDQRRPAKQKRRKLSLQQVDSYKQSFTNMFSEDLANEEIGKWDTTLMDGLE